MSLLIGLVAIAGAALVVRAIARMGSFYIRCPMCGLNREYARDNAIKRVNTMTAREIAERDRDGLKCDRQRLQRYSNAPAEWVNDGGCGAELVWLYLQHPFVRDLFARKAQLESVREFQQAHMDATEQEKLP